MGIELVALALIAVLLGCFGWQLARKASHGDARRTPDTGNPRRHTAPRTERFRPRVPARRRRDRSGNTPGYGPESRADTGSFGFFGGYGSDHGGGGGFCDSGGFSDGGGGCDGGGGG